LAPKRVVKEEEEMKQLIVLSVLGLVVLSAEGTVHGVAAGGDVGHMSGSTGTRGGFARGGSDRGGFMLGAEGSHGLVARGGGPGHNAIIAGETGVKGFTGENGGRTLQILASEGSGVRG
jgi:hypothetical protein